MIPKRFTEADVHNNRIICTRSDLIQRQPKFQQTVSGYGAKLNSGYMISYCGRLYRIYVTIYSNIGTCWFTAKGQRIVVDV